ncbi:MAG: glycoside hydrolase, partial [Bacteroidales bacterium]|nr:glycoside hydrolase [Bacteroidales bacterium]
QKPNVGKKGSVCTPEESDEFTNGHLGLQWQWAANSSIKWRVLLKGKDYLRLLAYPKADVGQRLWDTPNLLMQKFTAPTFTATTKVKFTIEWETWQGKRAGLVIMGNDYAYLSISKDDKGYHISQIFCENAPRGGIEEVVEAQMLPSSEVYMQVRVNGPNATCDFFYSTDGEEYIPIGKQLIAQPELWIGAKVGLFCAMDPGVRKGSYADFDWFRISH